MWEESQAENTKLRLELSGVRSELEQAKHQLENAEKKVGVELLSFDAGLQQLYCRLSRIMQ